MSPRAATLLFASCSLALFVLPTTANNPHGFTNHASGSFGSSFGGSAFAASEHKPVIQTKSSFNGCSTATGCGGLTVENGQITHQYGNPAALGLNGGAEAVDASEIHKNFAQQAADINSAFSGSLPTSGPFWWASQDSPFKNAYETYMKWIKNGVSGAAFPSPCTVCQLSNGKVTSDGGISNSIDISNNPFLNGQFSGGFSDSSKFGASAGASTLDVSKNPFLNGNLAATAQKPISGSYQSSFEHSSAGGNINIAGNPFLNGAITSTGCVGGGPCSQTPQNTGSVTVHQQTITKPSGAGCDGSSGSCGFQGQVQQSTGFVQQTGCVGCEEQQTHSQFPDFPQPTPNKPSTTYGHTATGGYRGESGSVSGELTVSCSGKGLICVEKHLCLNGFVNTNGENILQARGGVRCKVSTETCCKVKTKNENSFGANYYPTASEKGDSSSQQSISNVVTSQLDSSSLIHVVGTDQSQTGFGQTGFGQNDYQQQQTYHPGPTLKPGNEVRPPFNSQTNTFKDASIAQTQDQFYTRPGAGAVLKPGIPYLPPLDTTTTTQRTTPYIPQTRPTPSPTPYRTTPTPYRPPSTTTTTTQRTTPYKPPTTSYRPPTTTPYRQTTTPYRPTQPTAGPPYLPPKEDETPQQSKGSQQIIPGPRPDTEGGLLLDDTRNPPNKDVIIPSACAAALKCTKFEFCTADGMISNTTVLLTKEQQDFRVPLTDCREPEAGFVGKCCRDPTYTDPWPTNQLGQWVPGAFGDTGAYRGDTYRGGQNPGKPNNGGNRGNNGNGPKPAGSINTPIFTKNPNQPPRQIQAVPQVNPPKPQNNPPPAYNGNSFYTPNTNPPIHNAPKHPIGVIDNGRNQDNPTHTTGQLQLSNFNNAGSCGVRQPGRPSGNRQQFEVDFAEIPWQAMILLQTNKSLLCGGVITAPDAVVTSAHCVQGIDAKNVLIKGGEWKLGIDDEPKPFQIVQVSQILRHPGYQPGNLQNDLAILMLSEKLRFASNIGPVCLPTYGEAEQYLYGGQTKCIVTGWGKQVLQVNIPGSIMHSLDMNLIEPGQCQAQITQNYPHLLEQYNSNNCICGQTAIPNANVCKVDVGSALACTSGNGAYFMQGVYSWDSGCTSPNQIASFFKFDMTWYESTMESVSSQSQVYETYQNSNVQPQHQQQQHQQQHQQQQYHQQQSQIHNQYRQPQTQGQTYALTGQQAFQQAVKGHVHTGAQCQCNENGKK